MMSGPEVIDVHLFRCMNCYTVMALRPDTDRAKECACGSRKWIRIHVVPQDDKELTKFLKQVMAADKTPEYGYDGSDPDSHQNRAGQEPPVGERWMTPRELCKEYLRGHIPEDKDRESGT